MVKDNGVKITHSAADAFYNFYSQAALPLNKIINFKIKIVKITNKYLWAGVALNTMFGTSNGCHKDFLSYTFNGQYVSEKGASRNVPSAISNGDLIGIYVNRINQTVTWTINGVKLTDASIP